MMFAMRLIAVIPLRFGKCPSGFLGVGYDFQSVHNVVIWFRFQRMIRLSGIPLAYVAVYTRPARPQTAHQGSCPASPSPHTLKIHRGR